jgi:hypothetical protein
MSAVLPDLFGTPGREPLGSYVVSSMARACVSREFTVFATNKTSPAVRYLRELASIEHERCGGPEVGAPRKNCASRRIKLAAWYVRKTPKDICCRAVARLSVVTKDR